MQSMSLKQIRRIWKTNIRFSSLFAAGDTYEGRGETDVFAGYFYSIDLSLQRQLLLQIKFNLSMRQTILCSTIYPVLTQPIFKEISRPEYWSVLLNK